jgi:hypothetical protein
MEEKEKMIMTKRMYAHRLLLSQHVLRKTDEYCEKPLVKRASF